MTDSQSPKQATEEVKVETRALDSDASGLQDSGAATDTKNEDQNHWRYLREQFLARLWAFLLWIKIPSNLISVLAILAVVIVPWIEKEVKSDEELRNEVDLLITSTNKVIGFNEQRVPGAGSEMFSQQLATSQRRNELDRATALATKLRKKAYPSILMALANELCSSGEYDLAESYVDEVLNRGTWIHFLSQRPSKVELSSAHVVKSKCLVQQYQSGGSINPKEATAVNDEMAQAVALLQPARNDQQTGQLAITYAEWSLADDQMGDKSLSQSHRQLAQKAAQTMKLADPYLNTILGPPVPIQTVIPETLKPETLPRRPGFQTFLITYPDNPDSAGALLFQPPRTPGDYNSADATLFLYNHGLFTQGADWITFTPSVDDKNQLSEIRFQVSVPTFGRSGTSPRVQFVWDIQSMGKDELSGVQSEINQAPKRFVAKLSEFPQGHETTSVVHAGAIAAR